MCRAMENRKCSIVRHCSSPSTGTFMESASLFNGHHTWRCHPDISSPLADVYKCSDQCRRYEPRAKNTWKKIDEFPSRALRSGRRRHSVVPRTTESAVSGPGSHSGFTRQIGVGLRQAPAKTTVIPLGPRFIPPLSDPLVFGSHAPKINSPLCIQSLTPRAAL
jgi:hypothetical protein